MSHIAGTALLFVGLLAAAGCDHSSPTTATPTSTLPQTSSSIAIVPSSARIGSSGVTITITGSQFADGAHHLTNWATWVGSGSPQVLSTSFVDSSHITAHIPADLLREPVSALIYVTTACDQCDTQPNKGPATFVVYLPRER
jgi:IPT/TIG domain